jgi:putative ABC transport system permease protein
MRFFEGIVVALKSILANKLRSILTLIGIIIGVTTVIAVVSIINGMNNYVAVKINSMGSNTFVISKEGLITTDEEWFNAMKRKDLTLADLRAIERGCALCENVGGAVETTRRVKYGSSYLEDVWISGATYNFIDISDVEIAYGRALEEGDELRRAAVCLVGPDVVQNLIKSGSALGKDIKVGNYYFRIVGIGKKRGSFMGQNQDNWVVTPLTTYEKYFGRHRSIEIYAKARDVSLLEEAQDEARMILRSRRKLNYNQKDDFGMMTAGSIMQLYNSFTGVAWMVLVIISSISLLVGGIVIMNIMLVSVTERTREIGVRKAIGARRRDILWQFLLEAITLSIVGGSVGVLLGVGLALIIGKVSPLPASIEAWAVFSGLGVATSVGLIFGIFPALKAARLDPIESLRYE